MNRLPWSLLFGTGAYLSLAACATAPVPEPVVVTQTVDKAVAVSCVPANLPAPAVYPDTNAALTAATIDRRYQLLIAGRELRTARLGELEPVVKGCRQ
jgi:hypothetical protein